MGEKISLQKKGRMATLFEIFTCTLVQGVTFLVKLDNRVAQCKQ